MWGKGIAKISFLPLSLFEYFFYIKEKDKTARKSFPVLPRSKFHPWHADGFNPGALNTLAIHYLHFMQNRNLGLKMQIFVVFHGIGN